MTNWITMIENILDLLSRVIKKRGECPNCGYKPKGINPVKSCSKRCKEMYANSSLRKRSRLSRWYLKNGGKICPVCKRGVVTDIVSGVTSICPKCKIEFDL
jgi:hypothetical protein